MSAIETLKSKLLRRHSIHYEVVDNILSVGPESPEGFVVRLEDLNREYLVGFGNWSELFQNEAEAVDWFGFGLSDRCQLKVHFCGACEHRWVVQRLADGAWRDVSRTGSFFFPFWRPRSERIFQNRWIQMDRFRSPPRRDA